MTMVGRAAALVCDHDLTQRGPRIGVGQLAVETGGERVEDLPTMTAALTRSIRSVRGGGAPPRWLAAGVVALGAALTLTCCSDSTGGSATPQRSTASAAPASPTSAPAAAPSSAPVSDEDQVRQTVSAFNDAYNSQNWEAYTELMCVAMRNQFTGVVMDYVKKNRANTGANTIKSIAVVITGDDATASITGTNESIGSGTISLPLKREDGWKVCKLYHP